MWTGGTFPCFLTSLFALAGSALAQVEAVLATRSSTWNETDMETVPGVQLPPMLTANEAHVLRM